MGTLRTIFEAYIVMYIVCEVYMYIVYSVFYASNSKLHLYAMNKMQCPVHKGYQNKNCWALNRKPVFLFILFVYYNYKLFMYKDILSSVLNVIASFFKVRVGN